MKKLIAMLLAMTMVLGLVACGGNNAGSSNSGSTTTQDTGTEDVGGVRPKTQTVMSLKSLLLLLMTT